MKFCVYRIFRFAFFVCFAFSVWYFCFVTEGGGMFGLCLACLYAWLVGWLAVSRRVGTSCVVVLFLVLPFNSLFFVLFCSSRRYRGSGEIDWEALESKKLEAPWKPAQNYLQTAGSK